MQTILNLVGFCCATYEEWIKICVPLPPSVPHWKYMLGSGEHHKPMWRKDKIADV